MDDDLEIARRLLDLDEKWLQPFDVEDPMNDGLRLRGFLSLRPDHRYGALALTRVDGRPCPQAILATPKLHYPFDRNGTFRFPAVRSIRIHEKLDGTNVLAYRFADADGTVRNGYKLRLSPVLRNGRWGAFLDMWREMIARHPPIERVAETNGCAVSFELYGARNTHLVVYEAELECALLFGVGADGRPIPPEDLETLGLPVARTWGTLRAGEDPVARYAEVRAAMEARNRALEDGTLRGVEGTVWYVTDAAGRTSLFKCKPESVEAVHWAGGINKAAVLATCQNLLETRDRPTWDALLPLLREEYEDEEIEAFRPHIEACIADVEAQIDFRDEVLAAYRETGLSFAKDRGACMRALAARFPRDAMRRVFSVLERHAS